MQWRDAPTTDAMGQPINSGSHSLTYYLRTNTASEGATSSGVVDGSGWRFTISSQVSTGFDAGDWYFQAIATNLTDASRITLSAGSITILPSLSYSGTPSAYDGRSQAEKDLDAVTAAIRALSAGGAVQEYRIGQRSLKRYELSELLVLQSRLKAEVMREKKAEMIANGLGNPHSVFVRFGPKGPTYPVRPGYRW